MIDPDKLEAMAQVIYDRENQFNTYTLEKIAKRVKATGELSAYDQESLKNIADITGDMDAITKELARITKLNIADVEKIYAKTINDGINSYEPLYNFKNIEFKSYKDNEYALKLVRHWAEITAEKMINLSNSKIVGFTDSKGNFTTIAETYQQVIDNAIVAVSNGTVDFNSAMAETIKQLGGSGVVTNYGNKITRPIESAIRSNILYGAKKAAESYDNYVSEELGLDGFEVDAHSGCRKSHVFMQGKMYSYNGKKTIKGITYEDGTDALAALEDYGCLHFKTGVLLGVSEPRYSQEELEQIYKETTELIEYNGKKKTLYEWKQTQRRLEREYRKNKTQSDTFKAAGDNAKAREYKDAAKAIKDNYDTMTKAVPGLYKHHERMRTYFNSTASVKGTTPTPKIETPKKIFPKATSIEEAEKYASENLFTGYLGAKTSYKGIDLDIANGINEALENVTTKYGRKLSGIEVVNPKTAKGLKALGDANAPFATQSVTGKVFINKDILKDAKSLQAYNEAGEKAFETVIANKDKLSVSSRALAETYEKAGKSLVDDSLEGMITHEYGHFLNVQINPSAEVVEQLKRRMGSHTISGYSQHSVSEYLAECFVEYERGDSSKLDDVVIKIFEGAIK